MTTRDETPWVVLEVCGSVIVDEVQAGHIFVEVTAPAVLRGGAVDRDDAHRFQLGCYVSSLVAGSCTQLRNRTTGEVPQQFGSRSDSLVPVPVEAADGTAPARGNSVVLPAVRPGSPGSGGHS